MYPSWRKKFKAMNVLFVCTGNTCRSPIAETLMDDSVDRETTKKGIGVIIKESERLSGMVEELLGFSRLQSGVRLDCKLLDLVAELTDAALFVQARMQQEGG